MAEFRAVALAGNPNCGKTVIFNTLTGSHQRVGNWPGVTVEQKKGEFKVGSMAVDVVDLPGIYALSVTDQAALDEQITCQFLMSQPLDLLINVVDASHLERHLYLTLQLLELNIPVVLVVNMMDIVEKRGQQIDIKALSRLLQCPVVPMVAHHGQGVMGLKTVLAESHLKIPLQAAELLPLEPAVRQALTISIEHVAKRLPAIIPEARRHWMAQRLLEGDVWAHQQISSEVKAEVSEQVQTLVALWGEDPDIVLADARYRLAQNIAEKVVRVASIPAKQTPTDRIDRIVLHPWVAIPIFLMVMYGLFVIAINGGGLFQDFFDQLSSLLFVDALRFYLQHWHAPNWLTVLCVNGVGVGVNTVVTFIPVIAAMFLCLGWLEDSGYMARAAFVMDRMMRAVGLPGRAFVPMIVGFGCNVPAVMGARTLSPLRDRILTVLMMPFMSCGARLAIFSVFVSAFFSRHGALVIFSLYLLGIFVALLTGFLVRKTLLAGAEYPFIMELPQYHWPHWKSVMRQTLYRLRQFVFRAGKVIVPICVLLGILNQVSVPSKTSSQNTVLATMGHWATPLFTPMGMASDNWPATVGLATGVLAKEVVVGTLNSLYAPISWNQDTSSSVALFPWQARWQAVWQTVPNNFSGFQNALKNPLLASEASHEMTQTAYGAMAHRFGGAVPAFAYLIFVLLYLPCVSTLAAIRREIGANWATFSLIWSLLIAYSSAVLFYQWATVGSHWLSTLWWTLGLGMGFAGLLSLMKRWGVRSVAIQEEAELCSSP